MQVISIFGVFDRHFSIFVLPAISWWWIFNNRTIISEPHVMLKTWHLSGEVYVYTILRGCQFRFQTVNNNAKDFLSDRNSSLPLDTSIIALLRWRSRVFPETSPETRKEQSSVCVKSAFPKSRIPPTFHVFPKRTNQTSQMSMSSS